MKALLVVLLFSAASLPAQWMELKPADFEPLTSLPWQDVATPMETVLRAIFREPNESIRQRVLFAYLEKIPAKLIGRAFEICVPLESTENPDQLAALFIRVWAERDPAGCWAQMQRWFRVVGIEDGSLGYDSWKERDRITVQDRQAIIASSYWLTSAGLGGFPGELSRAKLGNTKRVQLLKEFSVRWLAAFYYWPRETEIFANDNEPGRLVTDFLSMELKRDPDGVLESDLRGRLHWNSSERAANEGLEIILRRELKANPANAPKLIQEAKKPPRIFNSDQRAWHGPSVELLMVWAKADLDGMVLWVDTLAAEDHDLELTAKAMLLSRVNEETQQRWIDKAKLAKPPTDEDGGDLAELFHEWAAWDFAPAVRAAVKSGQPSVARELANSAVYGPWRINGQPYAMSRHACGVLGRFDLKSIPVPFFREVFADTYSLMEQWDTMDVASAAPFGLNFLLTTKYAPRNGLILFFSGKDVYPDEGGMIDRTFCALRVWAVTKPEAMRKWSATLKDPEMEKALTWLLEHPWGGGKSD